MPHDAEFSARASRRGTAEHHHDHVSVSLKALRHGRTLERVIDGAYADSVVLDDRTADDAKQRPRWPPYPRDPLLQRVHRTCLFVLPERNARERAPRPLQLLQATPPQVCQPTPLPPRWIVGDSGSRGC